MHEGYLPPPPFFFFDFLSFLLSEPEKEGGWQGQGQRARQPDSQCGQWVRLRLRLMC